MKARTVTLLAAVAVLGLTACEKTEETNINADTTTVVNPPATDTVTAPATPPTTDTAKQPMTDTAKKDTANQ